MGKRSNISGLALGLSFLVAGVGCGLVKVDTGTGEPDHDAGVHDPGDGSDAGMRPGGGGGPPVTCTTSGVAPATCAPAAFGFDPGAPYDNATEVTDVAVGDMNCDGFDDVVTANLGNIRLWLNDKHGRFAEVATPPSTAVEFGFDLELADVDGNETLDVVTLGSGTSARVGVMLNAGDGRLAPMTDVSGQAVGTLHDVLAVGDVNGDGLADAVVLGNQLHVMLSAGGGRFAGVASFSGAGVGDPGGMRLADVNGDHKLDVVAAIGAGPTTSGIYVFPNTGHGTFGAARLSQVRVGTEYAENGLAVADFDGDGRLDAAVMSTGTDVLLGAGDGSFGAPRHCDFESGAEGWNGGGIEILAVDLNADGHPDLAATNFIGDTMSFAMNQGDGTFGAEVSRAVPRAATLAVGDFLGNKVLGVAVVQAARATTQSGVWVMKGACE